MTSNHFRNTPPTVRQVLIHLTLVHADGFWGSPEAYQRELRNACPDRGREITLVVLALRHEIVSEMRRLGTRLIPSILLPKLVRWFIRQTDLPAHEAEWAVHSWAMALGLVPFVDEALPPLPAAPPAG